MKEFKFRIGDLELRSCDESLIVNNVLHKTAEIVFHELLDSGKPCCFTLAYWRGDKEGFDLKFVGDRPFRYGDKNDFWTLAKMGQELLEQFLSEEEL